MNFLIDANLSRRLVRIFRERGHDANFDQLITELLEHRYVELTREHVIVHA